MKNIRRYIPLIEVCLMMAIVILSIYAADLAMRYLLGEEFESMMATMSAGYPLLSDFYYLSYMLFFIGSGFLIVGIRSRTRKACLLGMLSILISPLLFYTFTYAAYGLLY